MLITINSLLVGSLLLSGIDSWIIVLYVMLPGVILQVFSLVVILKYALEPLEILSRAVTLVSRQASDITPPNINEPRHEKTGLKSLVQTIYDRSSLVPSGETASDIEKMNLSSQAIDQLPCGIIAFDEKRSIVYANEAAPIVVDTTGQKSLELLFESDDTLNTWLAESEQSKVTDNHIWSRVQNRLPDDADRKVYDVTAHYQKGGAGGIDTFIVTIDRTAYYAANEEDMDFIALAAHELRGPITVIRGYLDVLIDELQPVLKGDQNELLERLSVSASRLSGYVSNILNVSRYDRRHLKLHLREDKLTEVYTSIADDLQLRARTQNRLLSVTIPGDLPTIAADRNSLSEVMANLVDNAIKYSSEGGQIILSAAVDGNFVKCSVTDNGIGIPSSVIGNLFTKFYRSHRSRQTVAGTGLGLYISKAIIESHGGKIGLTSKEGEGSVFTFSVPIYSTVADKLLTGDNKDIIESSNGWIKNHSMFRG